jgi:hypothetical protein
MEWMVYGALAVAWLLIWQLRKEWRKRKYMRGVVAVDGSYYNFREMTVAHEIPAERWGHIMKTWKEMNSRFPNEWAHWSELADLSLRRLDGPRWEQRICDDASERLYDEALKATNERISLFKGDPPPGPNPMEVYEAMRRWHPIHDEHAARVEVAYQTFLRRG